MKLSQGVLASGIVVIGAGAILAPRAWHLAEARTRADEAAISLDTALATEAQIESLRASSPAWLSRSKPTADVAALLQSAIRESGLPVTALAEVSPQESNGGSVRPGPSGIRWAEQTVVFRLTPLPLPDLGMILDRWRQSHPEWSIRSIDLQASDRAGTSSSQAGAGSYAATIRLTASYVE